MKKIIPSKALMKRMPAALDVLSFILVRLTIKMQNVNWKSFAIDLPALG
jgi:hypothetical protein